MYPYITTQRMQLLQFYKETWPWTLLCSSCPSGLPTAQDQCCDTLLVSCIADTAVY